MFKKVKTIGKKLIRIAVACILCAVLLTGGFLCFGIDYIADSLIDNETDAAINALTSRLDAMKGETQDAATAISGDIDLRKSVAKQDRNGCVNAVLAALHSQSDADFDYAVVADAKGTVVARTDSGDVNGSISSQADVKSAMKGTSKAFFIKSAQGDLCLSCACQLKDESKNIVGYVSLGYNLSKTRLLDTLKADNGCEYTIYSGDTGINTTLMSDGKRVKSNKLSSSAAAAVLTRKAEYTEKISFLGNSYYCQYRPIIGESGSIGALFTAKQNGLANSMKLQFCAAALLVALLVVGISIYVFNRFSKSLIIRPIEKMSFFAEKLSQGDLSERTLDIKSNDEIGVLSDSLQRMSITLRSYVMDISHNLELLSNGDMTGKSSLEYIGDFKPIQASLQHISESLSQTLAQIKQSAQQVDCSSDQVSSGAQALAQGAAEQASTVEELSATIETISGSISKTTQSIDEMTKVIKTTADKAGNMNGQMNDLVNSMSGIRDSSDKIQKIIQSIDDIAFQTNILALNAAVEAARAGAAGKGFAVVADEVRNLASKSAEASKETSVLIEDTLSKVQTGFSLTGNAANSAHDIFDEMQNIRGHMDTVSTAADEEKQAMGQIRQGIVQVSTVVQTNAATAEESAAASEELSGQADLLLNQVGKFKLNQSIDD